jgi:hypothetical protein
VDAWNEEHAPREAARRTVELRWDISTTRGHRMRRHHGHRMRVRAGELLDAPAYVRDPDEQRCGPDVGNRDVRQRGDNNDGRRQDACAALWHSRNFQSSIFNLQSISIARFKLPNSILKLKIED